jgi:hypothetical protein
MKKLKKLFEKSYFDHLYLAFEKRENGYGPYIHFFDEYPKDDELTGILPFVDFLNRLESNPVENVYFFGPLIDAYKNKWRFRLYINNRGLSKYFEDTSVRHRGDF